MTTSLWKKLKRCFYAYKKSSSYSEQGNGSHHYKINGRRIEYDGKREHALNGIIMNLTKEANGNVSDKGLVIAKSSTVIDNSHLPKFAMDLNNPNSYFESVDSPNSWLQYDFKQRKVHPTHYTIRSRPDNSKGGYHLKTWIIEGSNDEKEWKTLDIRKNITSLDDRSAIDTFEIQQPLKSDEAFRFLRICQTDTNIARCNFMVISSLEYFGVLFDES